MSSQGKVSLRDTMITKGKYVTPHISHKKSWMEPNANKNRLLYVSDAVNYVVQVYNYPSNGTQNPPAGTLTGFAEPQGLCVDKSNNVWVANTGASNLLEYAHGGTSPINTLSDAGQYPAGCAVDPTTGNLAASNIISTSGGAGSISLYNGASGSPQNIATNLSRVYFLGYDSSGNLFADGSDASGFFGIGMVMAGSSTWTPLSLSGATINFPGGVQFDGTNVVVGDQSGSTGAILYQTTLSGSTLNASGHTSLAGTVDVVQYFIKKGVKGVIAPDAGLVTADTFSYPGGLDRPNKNITLPAYSQPIGSAVSLGN